MLLEICWHSEHRSRGWKDAGAVVGEQGEAEQGGAEGDGHELGADAAVRVEHHVDAGAVVGEQGALSIKVQKRCQSAVRSARDGQCVHNRQDTKFTVALMIHSYWRFRLHAGRFSQQSATP